MSLGERLLGRPGFFIMDDAFISSDSLRFDKEVGLIGKLAQRGWQVLYLTASKEVAERLSTIADNPVISFEPLS